MATINMIEFIKKKWYWLIPVLLFISFFGWTAPYNDNLQEQIPSQVVFICQITGFLSALLLGVWAINYVKLINYWAKASGGVIGIFVAYVILMPVIKVVSYVYFMCAITQLLWLIFIFIYKSRDENFLKEITYERTLEDNLVPIFGKAFISF